MALYARYAHPRLASGLLTAALSVALAGCHDQAEPNQPSAVELGSPALASSSGGGFAYVTSQGTNTVSVIATATNTVIATVLVGSTPVGVAITPDGSFAYVTNANSNTV